MKENSEIRIIVELINEDENYFLNFNFNEPIKLSLTSSDSEDVKTFFVELMNALIVEKFVLDFDSNANDIYSNIGRAYIAHLNIEIDSIYEEIPVY